MSSWKNVRCATGYVMHVSTVTQYTCYSEKQDGREAEKKAFVKSTEADAADVQKHNMKQHRH